MKSMLRNLIAILAGIFVGSIVNITLVNIGPSVIPLPEGANVTDMESLRESMALFTPANFVFPFLGHALGTFAGAFVAAKLSVNRQTVFALIVGLFFLSGGIFMVVTVGGPLWFIACDLLLAYIPMSFIGARLAGK